MLLLIIAIVILLVLLVGVWYVWSTPASAPLPTPAPVIPSPPEMMTLTPTTTWTQASDMCAAKGKQLCGSTDICPVKLQPPFDGMRPIDEWTPVKDSENSWLSIGNYDPEIRLCRTHEDSLGSKPVWGQDPNYEGPFRQRAYCCDK